jgi:hypothetical protein
MEITINNEKFKLSKISIGLGIDYQTEFGKDVFEEIGKINITKEYLNIADMIRFSEILFASIKQTTAIEYEKFLKVFKGSDKVEIEKIFIPAVDYIFSGLQKTVKTEKK